VGNLPDSYAGNGDYYPPDKFMATPYPSPPVTPGDVYTELIGMRADIRMLLTESALNKAHNTSLDSLHGDHEIRLRRIETDVIRIRAIATTIATIAGVLSGYLSSLAIHLH
jgi:hypothetical protein